MTASIRESWARLARCACQGARLMAGVPDYDTDVAHMRRQHPDRPVMSYGDFFRDRQNARYGADGRRGFRCC